MDLEAKLRRAFRTVFAREPEVIARAPGRAEFIGNHTDYNGGTVLGAAIDREVWVALARRNDGLWRFASEQQSALVVPVRAGNFTKLTGSDAWANYPLGVLAAMLGVGCALPLGFDFFACSDLPVGAGLSSSAAMELASALAFLAVTKQSLSRDKVVAICRHAENDFVGVPCGILDQAVSGFGEKGRLVLVDCRGPGFTTVPFPPGAHLWVFNTQLKHALVDGLYAERHRECMEAARALGVAQLADIGSERFKLMRHALPRVVAMRASHVIDEIERVENCVVSLRAGNLAAVGRLMTASHHSSRTLFENSTPELDFLVEQLASCPHVCGARLTGGGFGGAVLALAYDTFGPGPADAVAAAYRERFGFRPEFMKLGIASGAQVLTVTPLSAEK